MIWGQLSKWSSIGLNSEFSFSKAGWHTNVKELILPYLLIAGKWTFWIYTFCKGISSIWNANSPPCENGEQLLENQEVVISRFCIGHTRLTHSFILQQELQPQCLTCQITCMVKHILIECRAFAVIRKRFFKVTSLTELFENVKIDDVLSFLRETGLYEKIWRIKTGSSCANKWNPAYRKFYLQSIRSEIFGWMYIHIDRIWR